MSVEQEVIRKLKALPPQFQQEVLDFASFLEQKRSVKRTRDSVRGLWRNIGVDIGEEDLARARAEMWSVFPRRDI